MPTNQLLDALTREGVLYSVSVRYWRAARKLRAEDIGLVPGRINKRLYSLGHKLLLPRDTLADFALVESRAHAAVESCSFPFLGGVARFVPNSNIDRLTNTLGDLKQEFDWHTGRFIGRYDSLREAALAEWGEAARELDIPAGEFTARIAGSYPPVTELRRAFGFSTRVFQISVPGTLSIDAVDIGDQMAVARAREEVARRAGEQLAEDTGVFIAECVARLREQTACICDEMLESMRSGRTGGVHQRTLNRLLNFIDEFRNLNFAGDSRLEELLENARGELLSTPAGEYRDNASALGALESGLKRLGREARDMAREDAGEIIDRFGRMGVRRFRMSA